MSTSGCSAVVLAPPSAVPLSATRPRRFAPGTASRIVLTARSTLSEVRPLTITSAPSRARTRAISRPMPPVDAVTSARCPRSCRSMFILRFRTWACSLMLFYPHGHVWSLARRRPECDLRAFLSLPRRRGRDHRHVALAQAGFPAPREGVADVRERDRKYLARGAGRERAGRAVGRQFHLQPPRQKGHRLHVRVVRRQPELGQRGGPRGDLEPRRPRLRPPGPGVP